MCLISSGVATLIPVTRRLATRQRGRESVSPRSGLSHSSSALSVLAMAVSLASMAFHRGLRPKDVAALSGLPNELVDGIIFGDVPLSSLSPAEQASLARAFDLSRGKLLEAERRREAAKPPESLRLHFWDTRFDALDRKANQDQIVTRLLERAGTTGLRWIIYAYTPSPVSRPTIPGVLAAPRRDVCGRLPRRACRYGMTSCPSVSTSM